MSLACKFAIICSRLANWDQVPPRAREVLTFWFGPEAALDETPSSDIEGLWWGRSPNVDTQIGRRFGTLYEEVRRGACDEWLRSPSGWVAQILVLDQFPRHIYRRSARSYESDALGLVRASQFYDKELFKEVSLLEQYFTTMPFTHHEDAASQIRCVRLSREIAEEAPLFRRSWYQVGVDFARVHADIIMRFGRFPHRNDLLERTHTLEEIQYLKCAPSVF